MSQMSREKGKAGEREIVHVLEAMGFSGVRRTAQYRGNVREGAPDVECDELPHIHLEVKRVERLAVEKAMKQAEADASHKLHLPVLLHRQNQTEWLMTIRLENLTRFVEMIHECIANRA